MDNLYKEVPKQIAMAWLFLALASIHVFIVMPFLASAASAV
jgi:hypothetical protein